MANKTRKKDIKCLECGSVMFWVPDGMGCVQCGITVTNPPEDFKPYDYAGPGKPVKK